MIARSEMRPFVQLLTDLTGCRSHDALNSTLARALGDLVPTGRAAIHCAVGAAKDKRWLPRFQAQGGRLLPLPAGEYEDLPLLSGHPDRCAALAGKVSATALDGSCVTTFPMSTEREVVGVFEMRSGAALSADTQYFIATLLQAYTNLQVILDDGQCDTLTGLLNRKTFDNAFLKAASVVAEAGVAPPLEQRAPAGVTRHWVGMIDIDFFKSVNDKFGHLIGDEVLLLVAQLMRTNCRTEDLIYRFGGEEFVVLLQCPTEEIAGMIFERLRVGTARYVFPQVGKVTVSIGFTELQAFDSPAAALGRADKAVYYAKQHGRNQVHNYARLAQTGEFEVMEQAGAVELF